MVKEDKKMARIKITQVISKNGATKNQRACLSALGLHRINHSVEHDATPVIKGMVTKVLHLVKVEEID